MARIVKKLPAKPRPDVPSSPGILGSTWGAACAMRTIIKMNVPIQEYFSKVWMNLKPKMDMT
jgi:hypothetical protein